MKSTVTARISACFRSPLLASPESSEEQFNLAISTYKNSSEPLELPIGRQAADGSIEVLWGWYFLEAAKIAQTTKIEINLIAATDAEAAHFGITKSNEHHKLKPMQLASALSEAKKLLKMSDAELGKAIDMKRATINRLLTLQKKLCPEAYEAVSAGHIGISIAKKLSPMTVQQQRSFMIQLKKHNYQWQEFEKLTGRTSKSIEHHDSSDATPPKQNSTSAPFKEKDIAHKRYEMHVSSQLGAPVSINEHIDTDGGELIITGFSAHEIEGVIEKLASKSNPCELKIKFHDNEHLESIIGSDD